MTDKLLIRTRGLEQVKCAARLGLLHGHPDDYVPSSSVSQNSDGTWTVYLGWDEHCCFQSKAEALAWLEAHRPRKRQG